MAGVKGKKNAMRSDAKTEVIKCLSVRQRSAFRPSRYPVSGTDDDRICWRQCMGRAQARVAAKKRRERRETV
jgi:hypothetical protein